MSSKLAVRRGFARDLFAKMPDHVRHWPAWERECEAAGFTVEEWEDEDGEDYVVLVNMDDNTVHHPDGTVEKTSSE